MGLKSFPYLSRVGGGRHKSKFSIGKTGQLSNLLPQAAISGLDAILLACRRCFLSSRKLVTYVSSRTVSPVFVYHVMQFRVHKLVSGFLLIYKPIKKLVTLMIVVNNLI